MKIEKIEIKGSDENTDSCFLQKEIKAGHLFIICSSFGNLIDDVKAEEFITNEIFETINNSKEVDSFLNVQNAIVHTNEILLSLNQKRENQIIASVLVLLIGSSESWCFYVGSTSLNISVKGNKTPYKKLFSSEKLINSNGTLSTCMGFKKIIPLEQTTQIETSKPNADGKVRTTNRTVYIPNSEMEYDEKNDYLPAYKKLNITNSEKNKSKKFRFLMGTSEFDKAFRGNLKESLLNNEGELSEVKENYEQQIEMYIRSCEDNNREYKSIMGVLVEYEE